MNLNWNQIKAHIFNGKCFELKHHYLFCNDSPPTFIICPAFVFNVSSICKRNNYNVKEKDQNVTNPVQTHNLPITGESRFGY